jgi:tetratricopeptide (TPR) repeat protein
MVAREQGDYTRAIQLYGESLALWRRLDDPRWIAIVTSSLGITHRYEGNAEQAHPMLDESQDLFSRLGDRYMLGVVAHNKGHLAFADHAFDQAIALYADALQHFESVGVSEGVIESIEWLAVAIAAKGHAAPALRLFGAAETAREALSLPPPTAADGQLIASGQARAHRLVSDGQALLEAGRMLSLEQARDEALVFADGVATAKR